MSDIEFYRGDSHTIEVEVTSVVNAVSAAVDITGSSSKLTVKEHAKAVRSILQKTGTITNAVTGKVKFDFVPADTDSLTPGEYQYDVEVTLATGKVYTILRGSFTLLEDITT